MAWGIPWYWPKDSHWVMAGLPVWVITSLVSSGLASAWTAWIIMHYWPPDTSHEAVPSTESKS